MEDSKEVKVDDEEQPKTLMEQMTNAAIKAGVFEHDDNGDCECPDEYNLAMDLHERI
jgi:hypothetical protein